MTRAEPSPGFIDLSEFDDEYEETDADRRRRRKRWLIALGVALVIIALAVGAVGVYVHAALTAPLPEPVITTSAPTVAAGEAVAFRTPPFGASAISVTGAEAFAGTVGTNGILTSSGSSDAASIASITKLITAMVILDAKPLAEGEDGPRITFSEADEDLYDAYYVQGATIQPMDAGSSLTERQTLELMLVGSASNYADAASGWAFGSRAAFLRATDRWLDANGLAGTTVVDPTGLDPRNRSTPSDLIALGRIALANPVVAGIVSTPSVSIDGVGTVQNNNTLVGQAGITGLKTGTLEAAGSCLLFSASVDVGIGTPVTMIGVVLGGDDRESVNNSVLALMQSIEDGFHPVPVSEQGRVVGTVRTAWGDTADLIESRGDAITTWSDTPISVGMIVQDFARGADGDEVGSLVFTGESITEEVPLVLDGTIGEPDEWWRLTHHEELLGW